MSEAERLTWLQCRRQAGCGAFVVTVSGATCLTVRDLRAIALRPVGVSRYVRRQPGEKCASWIDESAVFSADDQAELRDVLGLQDDEPRPHCNGSRSRRSPSIARCCSRAARHHELTRCSNTGCTSLRSTTRAPDAPRHRLPRGRVRLRYQPNAWCGSGVTSITDGRYVGWLGAHEVPEKRSLDIVR